MYSLAYFFASLFFFATANLPIDLVCTFDEINSTEAKYRVTSFVPANLSDFGYKGSIRKKCLIDLSNLPNLEPTDTNQIYSEIPWQYTKIHRENMNSTFSPNDQVPTWGPFVSSYFSSDSAELIYVEQLVPSEGDNGHIYWSGCNFFFGQRGGYAGIQHQVGKVIDGVHFEQNNICSVWDLKDTDSERPPEVKLAFEQKGLHWSHFDGEGTGLHTSHPMPWLPNQWYAIVMRRWYIKGEQSTRMAMFMYSYFDKQWTHYMSAIVPGKDIPLTGKSIAGFLERFAGTALGYYGIYGQHYRMKKHGSWEKPLFYEASAGGNPNYWKAELEDGVNIKLTAGGTFHNWDERVKLYPNQFDAKPKPVIDPILKRVSVSQNTDHSVTVQWEISEKTPPQLSAYVEIWKASGIFVTSKKVMLPEMRYATFASNTFVTGRYAATVRFRDIFNQLSNSASYLFNVK